MNNPLKQSTQNIDDERALIILKKLQGQLELRSLLMLYHHEVSKHIDLAQLAWDNDIERVTLRSDTISLNESQGDRQTFLLRFGEQSLGILQYQSIHRLEPLEIELLHSFHRLLAGPLSNALAYQEAKALAYRHHLSGLYNQLRFESDLEELLTEVESINAYSSLPTGLILLLFAIEPLKTVSFPQGQKVILQLGHILKQFNEPVKSYHLNNNQFALLLHPITAEQGAQIALEIEKKINEETQLGQLKLKHLLGYAEYQPNDTSLSMLERANQELHLQTLKHKDL